MTRRRTGAAAKARWLDRYSDLERGEIARVLDVPYSEVKSALAVDGELTRPHAELEALLGEYAPQPGGPGALIRKVWEDERNEKTHARKCAEGEWLRLRGCSTEERIALIGHGFCGGDTEHEPIAQLAPLRGPNTRAEHLYHRAGVLATALGLDPFSLFERLLARAPK